MDLIDCKSLTIDQLRDKLSGIGVPAYRAEQIRSWLDRGTDDFDSMTDLPLSLRAELKNIFWIPGINIKKRLVSKTDSTVKYLYTLYDGENVESVLMKYRHGWSQCLSTQAGCRMGALFARQAPAAMPVTFCPARCWHRLKKRRRTTACGFLGSSDGNGGTAGQFRQCIKVSTATREPGGVNIGMRRVTLSTCGIVDKIYRLMEHKPSSPFRFRCMRLTIKSVRGLCR